MWKVERGSILSRLGQLLQGQSSHITQEPLPPELRQLLQRITLQEKIFSLSPRSGTNATTEGQK